jgi:hypothetical protein
MGGKSMRFFADNSDLKNPLPSPIHETPVEFYAPEPTASDLESPEFNAVWDAIKKWDISRYSNGIYEGATGTDVMRILTALRKAGVE